MFKRKKKKQKERNFCAAENYTFTVMDGLDEATKLRRAIKTFSAIFKASAGSLSLFIPNTKVQAPTPNALAIQSSFPISSQGNLKDSSIFFRS